MHVFSTYETEIMTSSKGVVKKVCLAFSLVHISFSKNLVYPACAEF